MPKNETEIRCMPVELRAEESEKGTVITGYPIVFDQEIDMGEWREVIDAGSMGDGSVLKDVMLLTNHDRSGMPLARSRRNNESSTMRLTPDQHGVAMWALLDKDGNPRAKEACSAVGRGDITGMSFAFIANEERWEDLDTEKPLRRIMAFGWIPEVSLVNEPAYKGTTVQVASEGEALDSVRASLERARKQLAEERAREQDNERRQKALEILRK